MSTNAPRFSIITPVYDPPVQVLEACLDSVTHQTFEDWELCLVDDASPSAEVRTVLARAAEADPRVRLTTRSVNGGIIAASNDALAMATGEFVAFLDHDDMLVPHALAAVLETIGDDPTVDYCYTDEDHMDPTGRCFAPFHKPDWSPERLRSQNYTCHLSVMRRSLVDELGGFREGYEGAQDYDLILRVTERARTIVHARKVLYHWRMGDASTSANAEAKPYAYEAGRRAVAAHCDRVDIDCTVEPGAMLGIQRVRRSVKGTPLVSVVIPTRGSSGRVWGRDRTLVTEAVRSVIERSTYSRLEFVIVADRVTPPEVLDDLHSIVGDRLQLRWFDGPFNFSEKINVGAIASSGDLLLLLNDDIEIIDGDWLEAMIPLAQDPDVGLVGARLLFSDGTLQHAGHLYTGGNPTHAFLGRAADEQGPRGLLMLQREAAGVTAACAMTRPDVFRAVGGFTTALPNNFNDVDFCLKVRHLGFRIVWTPYASLYHFESQTRTPNVQSFELDRLRARWERDLANDPYHNPNYVVGRDDCVIEPAS